MPFVEVAYVASPYRPIRVSQEYKPVPLQRFTCGSFVDNGRRFSLYRVSLSREIRRSSCSKSLHARSTIRQCPFTNNFPNEESEQHGEGKYMEETIAAIITVSSILIKRSTDGPGGQQGSVSIIRLSGPGSLHIAARLFRPSHGSKIWKPESHRIYHGFICDVDSILDEVLLLVMLKPRSYTCEDVIEIHTHGGGVCALRVLQACLGQGARQALAGEFTMRAFLNGRLTLAQAESVAELINARTVVAADAAVAGLTGGLSSTVVRLRSTLLTLLANVEASIDFEDDVGTTLLNGFQDEIKEVSKDLDGALLTATRGHLLAKGLQIPIGLAPFMLLSCVYSSPMGPRLALVLTKMFRNDLSTESLPLLLPVALVGRPNVGKSSLLNALSGCERAIVTDVPGTTRDVVEAAVNMQGIPVILMDTAGLRTATDRVEYLGVHRARSVALAADIVVMVVDSQVGWSEDDLGIYRDLWDENAAGTGSPAILALNKSDIAPCVPLVPSDIAGAFRAVIPVSAKTNQGLPSLQSAILEAAGLPQVPPGGRSWAVNERQAGALLRARQALTRVIDSVGADVPVDCWTVDLRHALLALGEVTGDNLTEEVLQAVFSRFCIGK